MNHGGREGGGGGEEEEDRRRNLHESWSLSMGRACSLCYSIGSIDQSVEFVSSNAQVYSMGSV